MTTAFWSNTESVRSQSGNPFLMLSVSIQSDCSGEQSKKSSWTTQCSSLLLEEKLLHNPLKDASWSSYMCFVPLGRLLQNLLQLGALIIIKQFLLAHIPLFCEDCPSWQLLSKRTWVRRHLCLYLLNNSSCLPPALQKLCSIPSRYNDICTEDAQWSFTRALCSENSTALPLKAEECSSAFPSCLGWVTAASSFQLVFLLPLSLLPVAPSCQQKILLVLCQLENNRGCVLYILLPQSKTLS